MHSFLKSECVLDSSLSIINKVTLPMIFPSVLPTAELTFEVTNGPSNKDQLLQICPVAELLQIQNKESYLKEANVLSLKPLSEVANACIVRTNVS